ncbi:hypothetical protein [Alteromonas sp. ASW11-130]|uniref:hypothetical protein n=1 Tax=Alteromonas sp. ASW11-130 TaxID=3015775 RepID=UPI00224227BB|nr:hypothetical protein [Alteromonas sp. ASW11-130]MCW8090992.1 hypothetical protein [Alteromonas sp. ASW11-130]
MMNIFGRTCCVASLAMAGSSCFAADSLSSGLGNAITKYLNSGDDFAVTFTNKKLKFHGTKLREYELMMAQQLSSHVSVEASLHYEKGRLDYGVLNQRVSSKGYQLASWYQMGAYSVGISNKVISEHEINIPLVNKIDLPTSKSLAFNMRTKGFRETHELSFSAERETWTAENPLLGLSWAKAYDNQVKMSYSIIF